MHHSHLAAYGLVHVYVGAERQGEKEQQRLAVSFPAQHGNLADLLAFLFQVQPVFPQPTLGWFGLEDLADAPVVVSTADFHPHPVGKPSILGIQATHIPIAVARLLVLLQALSGAGTTSGCAPKDVIPFTVGDPKGKLLAQFPLK